MSFKAEQRDIDYLLSNKLYEIPRNQRRYVWNKDNWDDLWSDLEFIVNNLPQFGITECLIQHKCSVHTPPSHAIRSG